jgi:hypothetical protein
MNEIAPAWFYTLQQLKNTVTPVTVGKATFVPLPSLYRLNRWLDQMWETVVMARNKSPKRNLTFAEVEFINRRLTDDEAKGFADWQQKEAKSLGDEVVAFIASGHKLSVTWDDFNACFIVSATCKDEASDNLNKCLSARSDDWYEALLLVLYKSQVLFAGATWESDVRGASWG